MTEHLPSPLLLQDMLLQAAKVHSGISLFYFFCEISLLDKEAVVSKSRRLTYAQLLLSADVLSQHILKHTKPSSCVAIFMTKEWHQVKTIAI